MKVHFLPTVSVVFLLEYTVMLLLITSVKVRSTRTYMCEISTILLKFCARFWQISSKMFLIPPQISSIFSAWKEWQPCIVPIKTRTNLYPKANLKSAMWTCYFYYLWLVNKNLYSTTPFSICCKLHKVDWI